MLRMLVSTLNLSEDHNKDSAYLDMYLSCDTSYNHKFHAKIDFYFHLID